MNQLPPVPAKGVFNQAWYAFSLCLNKENYSRMSGRAGRFEYWSATIIGHFLMLLPLTFLLFLPNILIFILLPILLIFISYLAMPLLAVFVRRLHDVGWSGWWIVSYFALVCIVFGYCVFHMSNAFIFEYMDLYDLPVYIMELMSSIGRYTTLPINLLSMLLFVLTLLPEQKGINRYGTPL